MKRLRIFAFFLIFLIFLIIELGAVKLCFFSPTRASVTLSESRSCEIRTAGVYHWFTDRRIPLVYRKNGQEVGRVEFRFTPLWGPLAIFPTEDKEGLFCLSQTDLSIALFVIDLSKSAAPDHTVPEGLFMSYPPIISFTNFAVRGCTKDEVTYAKRFVGSLNNEALAGFCFWRHPYLTDPSAERLLSDIDVATSPPREPLVGDLPEVRYE